MAREVTQRQRAEQFYNSLLKSAGVLGYETPRGRFKRLQLLLAHDQQTRQEALREAAQQVCMHCGKRAIGLQVGVNGPNAAGNYVHNPPEDSRVKESVLCSATSIWSLIRYEDRLAQEGA